MRTESTAHLELRTLEQEPRNRGECLAHHPRAENRGSAARRSCASRQSLGTPRKFRYDTRSGPTLAQAQPSHTHRSRCSTQGPQAHRRRPAPSRLSRPLVWRVLLEHRHLDAEPGRELAGALTDGVGLLPRPRRVPAASADHALHAHRRRRRRSARSATDADGVAMGAAVDGRLAGGARVFRLRPGVAHPRALVHHGHRASVRRPGVSIADSVARRQAGSDQRDRAELDSVQRRAHARSAARRRHAGRAEALGRGRHDGAGDLFRPQRALVSRRDPFPDVAAHQTHAGGAHAEHARRAEARHRVRAASSAASWRSCCSGPRRRSSAFRC